MYMIVSWHYQYQACTYALDLQRREYMHVTLTAVHQCWDLLKWAHVPEVSGPDSDLRWASAAVTR